MNNNTNTNNKNSKYYYVHDKNLANTLLWLTGERYLIFDDLSKGYGKVYSFIDNNKIRKALDVLNNTRAELRNDI